MENFKIIEEKQNGLFNRKEIRGEVEEKITPSNIEVKDFLSKKYSVPRENIKIKKIQGKFGSQTFTILANIYENLEDKQVLEIKKKREIEEDKKIEEAKKAAEAPKEEIKEEPKEEKPIEEVKEEPQESSEETKKEEKE